MAKVDIFGTYHIDRPQKVEEELRDFSSEANIFFTEEPREEAAQSDWITLQLRNPTVWVAARFLNVFWGILGFILSQEYDSIDSIATRKIARERDIEMVPVDATIVQRESEVSLIITIFSWFWVFLTALVLVFAVLLWPKSLIVYGIPLSPIFFGSFAMAMSFIPVVPLAYLTLDERNDVIAGNIEKIFDERADLTRGCLVVGHKHIDGVVEALENSSVEVDNTHKPKFFRRHR